MLATLTRDLPADGYWYEPKWDGFRCLVRRDGDDVDLRSRGRRPFSRYFPELVAAFERLPSRDFVADGEIVRIVDGRADFATLMSRLHPASSRVALLAVEVPVGMVLFHVLSRDGVDLV